VVRASVLPRVVGMLVKMVCVGRAWQTAKKPAERRRTREAPAAGRWWVGEGVKRGVRWYENESILRRH